MVMKNVQFYVDQRENFHKFLADLTSTFANFDTHIDLNVIYHI